MQPAFEHWTNGRQLQSLGTNAGAQSLPFQSWRHFKEAFAPELVARAVNECRRPVARCIDPFGGSGTTALACQFLKVHPTTMEVNPYLADLIEAKLSRYDNGDLTRDYAWVVTTATGSTRDHDFSHLPESFIEPGVKGRWVFSRSVGGRIAAYLAAIAQLEQPSHRTFFRVILGGLLIGVSNVVVNGKGRRYRSGWQDREVSAKTVDREFRVRVESALCEIARFGDRPTMSYSLRRGDCRQLISDEGRFDLAVFSPPYPNSFDYTDVYNVELWMLGYLTSAASNRSLRNATLNSHVQIKRDFIQMPAGSSTLDDVSSRLHERKDAMWSRWIPYMIDGYFADMYSVLVALKSRLYEGGEVWAVVGDSLYAKIHIPVAKILGELAATIGYEVLTTEAFRSMRTSAQQGGHRELEETLLVLRN